MNDRPPFPDPAPAGFAPHASYPASPVTYSSSYEQQGTSYGYEAGHSGSGYGDGSYGGGDESSGYPGAAHDGSGYDNSGYGDGGYDNSGYDNSWSGSPAMTAATIPGQLTPEQADFGYPAGETGSGWDTGAAWHSGAWSTEAQHGTPHMGAQSGAYPGTGGPTAAAHGTDAFTAGGFDPLGLDPLGAPTGSHGCPDPGLTPTAPAAPGFDGSALLADGFDDSAFDGAAYGAAGEPGIGYGYDHQQPTAAYGIGVQDGGTTYGGATAGYDSGRYDGAAYGTEGHWDTGAHRTPNPDPLMEWDSGSYSTAVPDHRGAAADPAPHGPDGELPPDTDAGSRYGAASSGQPESTDATEFTDATELPGAAEPQEPHDHSGPGGFPDFEHPGNTGSTDAPDARSASAASPSSSSSRTAPPHRTAPRSRRRAAPKARRSALLTVAVPSVAVMGVAAVAAASVSGVGADGAGDSTQAAASDYSTAQAIKANSKLDTQLNGLTRDADDFADRASRTQERIDLKERQEADRKQRIAEAAKKEALRPKFALPVQQHGLSAYYGQSGVNWMSLHTGIDFPVSYGTPVLAATDGTVRTQWNDAYGNMIIVTAADGTETWYCHLSSTKIRSGQVKAGDTIGYAGSSGRSTGPHLHFEVRPGGGSPIDPLAWLRSHGLDPA